jgi:hypothetical protein
LVAFLFHVLLQKLGGPCPPIRDHGN